MHFTASVHTGSHAPVESKDISTRERVEHDWQCEHWSQSSYGCAALEWGCVAGSLCLPRCLHHENEESTGENKARENREWSEECECSRIWPYREWSVSRAWLELWSESNLTLFFCFFLVKETSGILFWDWWEWWESDCWELWPAHFCVLTLWK